MKQHDPAKTVALIVPSETYRADAFLRAAAELKLDVVTVSDTPQALSMVMGDHFLLASLTDPVVTAEKIAELSTRLHLDAVVAIDDGGSLCAAYAGERLGLIHNAPSAIAATRNKATMRELVASTSVTQPRYRVIHDATIDSVGDAVRRAAIEIGYPIVVKPASLSASRGVIRANDDEAAQAAGAWTHQITSEATKSAEVTLLVEQFIPGEEVAFEGRLRAGELERLALFDKPDPLDGPYFEETIYVRPSRLSPIIQSAMTEMVREACQAIGLTEGPIHTEARIDASADADSPEIVFLEVAARTIGGRCAKALTFNDGITIEEIVLRDALRIDTEPIQPDKMASGVMMLPIRRHGRLIEVAHQDKAREVNNIVAVDITVAPGRVLQPFPTSDRYLGFVFARASTPELVVRALRAAENELDVKVDTADTSGRVVRS